MKFASLVPALLTSISLAACGGGGDDTVVVVDAAIDAPIDAAIDAGIDAPPVCNAPNMVCGGQCTDVTTSEQFCGNCTTACSGGQVCESSACVCATDITIPASPSFFMPMVQSQGGLTLGIGPMLGNTVDVLVVGKAGADVAVNTPHTLSGASLGTPPFAAFGYDVNISTQTASAAYYATSGTLTFTKICLADSMTGQQAGFAGTLTNATFSAVDSLMNPVLVPGGCTFDVTGTVTFSFGNVTCP
ncbi:MAG: hypothetical protein JNK64_21165 [Myxococcales bacterium]|nr:hypothetical protein [Myxococcales bacterium]